MGEQIFNDALGQIDNWVSPRLNIRFDMSGDELQIYRPDGNKFFDYTEISQQLEQERQRAEEAEQRLTEMEAILRQYQERFGDLSQ